MDEVQHYKESLQGDNLLFITKFPEIPTAVSAGNGPHKSRKLLITQSKHMIF